MVKNIIDTIYYLLSATVSICVMWLALTEQIKGYLFLVGLLSIFCFLEACDYFIFGWKEKKQNENTATTTGRNGKGRKK